ncbi:ribosomal protein S18 acetylase RimI-like enzyme [Sporosarcina luteola]|nr:ribosomal protein S18 acetylase RimI-like enzyme [Sporosarcina luteola]
MTKEIVFYVRNYQEQDRDSVVKLYKQLIEYKEDVIYWWPGPENNWDNVYCVFNKETLIAKGQVQVINGISADYQGEANHLIYVNIKVDPSWENDHNIREILYDRLLQQAKLLKRSLPPQFPTKLCVGNYATESKDNSYFKSKGFKHFESLYWMNFAIDKELSLTNYKLSGVTIKHWNINTKEEQLKYLQAENEIWPENPTGLGKLQEFKRHPHWTSITAFAKEEIVGSVMAWKETDENKGVIENVFVKPNWRNHGLASHLIKEGIRYLQTCNLDYIQLLTETRNESALKLYKSIGFETMKEEKRYWLDL